VFFGYSNIHKGFKYLDISSVRIYISRDFIFNESIFWFASLNSNVGAPYHSDVLLLPPSQTGDNGTTNMTEVITVSVLPMVRPPVQLQQNTPPVVTVQDTVQAVHHTAPHQPSPMIGETPPRSPHITRALGFRLHQVRPLVLLSGRARPLLCHMHQTNLHSTPRP
jgi:hypothetical protein